MQAKALFDLEPQVLDHGLGDRIDRLNRGEERLAGFAEREQQAAFHAVKRELLGQVIGFGVMAELAQPSDQVLGSLCWVLCHGHTVALWTDGGIDFDQCSRLAGQWLTISAVAACRLP